MKIFLSEKSKFCRPRVLASTLSPALVYFTLGWGHQLLDRWAGPGPDAA